MRIPSRAARRLAIASLFGLAGTLALPALSSAAVPTEKALPGSTVLFLKAANAEKLRAAVKGSQFGQLLADPAMKGIKDDVASKMADQSKQLKEKVGVTLAELLTLPQGEVAVALIAKPDNAKNPAVLFISADAGANEAKMAEVMAKSTDLAKKDGTVNVEKFQDLSLTVIRSKKEDEKDNPPLVWTKQGSVFHIASDVDTLKDVLTNAKGREDSLMANESFAAVGKKLGADAQVMLFGDVAQILKLATQAGGGGNAGQIEAQLQLTGLNSLKAIGMSVAFASGDFDTVVKTYIHSPGPAQGLLKIFNLPKVSLKPQAWVPAGVSSYQTMSWDFVAAFNAVSELADMFAPGMIANLEKGIGGPDGNGLNFKKDIFEPLGDRVTAISDVKKNAATRPAAHAKKADADIPQRTLIAVALEDSKTFQATFNKVLGLLTTAPKKREFQGTTIYDFEVPELPNNAGGAQIDGPISVAIAKDNLFLTTDATLLEQVLRGGGQGLAESPAFAAVAKFYPPQSSTLSFQRPEDQAKALYDMVKSGQFKKAVEEAAKNADKDKKVDAADVGKATDLIDPAKLPDFSRLLQVPRARRRVRRRRRGRDHLYPVHDQEGRSLIRLRSNQRVSTAAGGPQGGRPPLGVSGGIDSSGATATADPSGIRSEQWTGRACASAGLRSVASGR